jgi:hypothetical protein
MLRLTHVTGHHGGTRKKKKRIDDIDAGSRFIEGRSMRVFGVRPSQPSARRVSQPAALP